MRPTWGSAATELAPVSEGANLLDRLPRRVMLGQLLAIGLLGTLHAVLTWAPAGTHHPLLVRLFDVDREMNLPTWFASAQWMMLALTFLAIAILAKRNGRSSRRLCLWFGLAAVAAYLSADEVAVLHERLGTVLEEVLLRAAPDSTLRSVLRFPSYYWIVAYAPVFVPAAAGLAIFIWRELGRARSPALLGIFVFLYAAVGLDFIEGRFGNEDHARMLILVFSREIRFDIFLMEESLEMLGVAFLLYAFLRYLTVGLSRRLPGAPGPAVRTTDRPLPAPR